MKWITKEGGVSSWSARHYAGGDTVLQADLLSGRTVWRIVPAGPGQDGIDVDDGWKPEPGTAYRTRSAAMAKIVRAAENMATLRRMDAIAERSRP